MTSQLVAALANILLALTDCVAAAVGVVYAGRRGWPKNFDRDMYWTAHMATGAAGVVAIYYSKNMSADFHTPKRLLQYVLFQTGFALFGASGGFLMSIFTRRSEGDKTDSPG
jgi:hypothetical protein